MIRVSCSTFSRIQHRDGRLLVILNKNNLEQGRRVLTAIGGATHFRDERVLRELGAEMEKAGAQDLRFKLEETKLEDFCRWFHRGEGRETDPFRELYEEVVAEEGLVLDLAQEDVRIRYLGLDTPRRASARANAFGELTQYYFEVFEVALPEDAWAEIEQRLADPQCHARLVSAEEIHAGEAVDGTKIGDNCRSLLKFDSRTVQQLP